MLLAECSESISHNHTAHIKKCPDSIVGKRQRPQAFLIYSYVISTVIGTWHSVLQSQHSMSDTHTNCTAWSCRCSSTNQNYLKRMFDYTIFVCYLFVTKPSGMAEQVLSRGQRSGCKPSPLWIIFPYCAREVIMHFLE